MFPAVLFVSHPKAQCLLGWSYSVVSLSAQHYIFCIIAHVMCCVYFQGVVHVLVSSCLVKNSSFTLPPCYTASRWHCPRVPKQTIIPQMDSCWNLVRFKLPSNQDSDVCVVWAEYFTRWVCAVIYWIRFWQIMGLWSGVGPKAHITKEISC